MFSNSPALLLFLLLRKKKANTAMRTRIRALPMAMPTIAPVDSELPLDDPLESATDDVVVAAEGLDVIVEED